MNENGNTRNLCKWQDRSHRIKCQCCFFPFWHSGIIKNDKLSVINSFLVGDTYTFFSFGCFVRCFVSVALLWLFVYFSLSFFLQIRIRIDSFCQVFSRALDFLSPLGVCHPYFSMFRDFILALEPFPFGSFPFLIL